MSLPQLIDKGQSAKIHGARIACLCHARGKGLQPVFAQACAVSRRLEQRYQDPGIGSIVLTQSLLNSLLCFEQLHQNNGTRPTFISLIIVTKILSGTFLLLCFCTTFKPAVRVEASKLSDGFLYCALSISTFSQSACKLWLKSATSLSNQCNHVVSPCGFVLHNPLEMVHVGGNLSCFID